MIQLSSRKLNLGCAYDKRQGYVNVDMGSYCNPDVQANVLDLTDFPSCYYEEILTLGVIEHFKRVDTRRALYEWNRLLVPGGRLVLTTTYLEGLVRKLEARSLQSVAGHELVLETLFAGQQVEGDYHLTAFTELLLRYYLWECGFAIDKLGLHKGWLFEVEAHKTDDYSFVELENEKDDGTFLRMAYRAILSRDADASSTRHYGDALAGRLTARRAVLKELLLCPERKQAMIARAPQFPRAFDPDIALADDCPVPGAPSRSPRTLLSRLFRGGRTKRPEMV